MRRVHFEVARGGVTKRCRKIANFLPPNEIDRRWRVGAANKLWVDSHVKKLAGFLVQGVRLALYAKLLDLKTVRIITTVLLCNVVAVFALFACQCDLGTDVAGLAHCFLTSLKHNLHVLVYL